jgi:hypothetical protein
MSSGLRAPGKVVTLTTLVIGIAIGFSAGILYRPRQEVQAQAVTAPSPTIQEVFPGMVTGSFGANLILAHEIAADDIVVNGFDLLKMQQNILNYLASRPLAERADIQNLINASRAFPGLIIAAFTVWLAKRPKRRTAVGSRKPDRLPPSTLFQLHNMHKKRPRQPSIVICRFDVDRTCEDSNELPTIATHCMSEESQKAKPFQHLRSDQRSRDVGCYLGLRPKRSQSGDRDPQLGITKAGNIYLRTLLVECANHVLGPHGRDSTLRQWGLHLASRGGKQSRNRAIVAVARKLAVLLHRIWITQEPYIPFYQVAA